MTGGKPAVPFFFAESALPFGRAGVEIRVLVTDVVHEERSAYGLLQVFDTPFYGRMLVLDGVIQATLSDDSIYSETMVYGPCLRHGAPGRILVIGGGDGGAIKHALRVPSVREVVLVEIDPAVIDVSRRHLPELSDGAFDDPRVQVVHADGAEFVRRRGNAFDVVVLDLTDPMPGGPAEPLYAEPFYRDVREALTPGGVVALHAGSLIFQPAEAGAVRRRLEAVWPEVALHVATVPAYQLSPFAFFLAANSPSPSMAEIERRYAGFGLAAEFVTPEVYASSQVLPPYLRRQVYG